MKHDQQGAIDQIYSLAQQFGIPLPALLAMRGKRKFRKATTRVIHTETLPTRKIPVRYNRPKQTSAFGPKPPVHLCREYNGPARRFA